MCILNKVLCRIVLKAIEHTWSNNAGYWVRPGRVSGAVLAQCVRHDFGCQHKRMQIKLPPRINILDRKHHYLALWQASHKIGSRKRNTRSVCWLPFTRPFKRSAIWTWVRVYEPTIPYLVQGRLVLYGVYKWVLLERGGFSNCTLKRTTRSSWTVIFLPVNISYQSMKP